MSHVVVTDHASFTEIHMDDGKANALSFAMIEAVHSGLDHAASRGGVVALMGRDGKFSAGFDLSVMQHFDAESMRLLRSGADLAMRLLAFNGPVILGVTGHALAMGGLLCLAADHRVGVRGGFKLGLNEVAIGMTMPWFGVELCRARLNRSHMDQALGLARLYSPDDAQHAGFLDEVVEPEAMHGRVAELAEMFAKLDMPSPRATKARSREILLERFELAIARDFAEGASLRASA